MTRTRDWRRGISAGLLAAALSTAAGLSNVAQARITRLELTSSPAYEEVGFGDVGRYQKLVGRAHGELDPHDPHNAIIQDIGLAPRNARGMVEYSTDVYLVRPLDSTGNDTLLVDLPNRGNKFSVYSFNHDVAVGAALTDPAASLAAVGDGFLQSAGFTLLWVGWQGDLLAAQNRMRAQLPVATRRDGSAIIGRVRAEYMANAPVSTQSLSSGVFTGQSHESYRAVSLDTTEAVLTRRRYQDDPGERIPAHAWAFADCDSVPFPGEPSDTRICLQDGFDPAYIYELVYTAHSPRVLGIGLAAVRDVVSFLRYAAEDDVGNANPLAGRVSHSIAYGLSQAGRFVRTFVHLGFNADTVDRIVFDGINAHIAPAHIPVNVRFGQPGRAYGQREEHTFPAAEGPVSWGRHESRRWGLTDGMLRRCSLTGTCPRVIQTISSIEYWQGRASLATANKQGTRDIELPDQVRLYHFAGTQHVPGGGQAVACQYPNNANSYREGQRALLVAHQRWIADGVPPPPNRFPLVRDGELQTSAELAAIWPSIPGADWVPRENEHRRLWFGPHFDEDDESGVMIARPRIGPHESLLLVPAVGTDGNELAGIRSAALQAPLGTYAGWNIRREGFGFGDLCGLSGSFFPFPATEAERAASGDPRPSLEERYGDHAGYVASVRAATVGLVANGFLLQADADRLVAEAEASDVLE